MNIGRCEVPGCEIDWVTHDYQTASTQAMQHLIELGHRRIAFVSKVHLEPQLDKLAGCHRALIDRLDVELLNLQSCDFDSAELFAETLRRQRITALMCDDRIIFEHVLALLHAEGIRVPEQLSVLSLTTADHSLPYLLEPTHVQLDQRRAGEVAIRTLVSRIKREVSESQQIMLPGAFVPGETTGAVPS